MSQPHTNTDEGDLPVFTPMQWCVIVAEYASENKVEDLPCNLGR